MDLYFITIIPPKEIEDKITDLKLEIAERFGSSHALKAPPHITLHMPFKWKDKNIQRLKSLIKVVNDGVESFEVRFKDYNFFEPRVVFVSVEPSVELEDLQKEVVLRCRRELDLENGDYKNRAFHPHVIIGFRDLKKSKFYEAKEYFEGRKFGEEFMVTQISLLKHDGKKWKVIEF